MAGSGGVAGVGPMGGPASVVGGVGTGAACSGAVKKGGATAGGVVPGVAVTGIAVDVAELGPGAGLCGANGGVAVDGIGMAGLAVAVASCEVMTFELPGGSARGTASVGGASATLRFAASLLRAATAWALLGLNVGGSVACLTWSAEGVDWSGPVAVGSAEMESAESSCARAGAGQSIALPQTALKKIAGRSHLQSARPSI